MVIEVGWLFRLPLIRKAAALTAWPFILVRPGMQGDAALLLHESAHLEQQRRWVIYGLGIGLLAWYLLYLFALPVGWNPWRRDWELEAMRAEGRQFYDACDALKRAPYHLWWM